MNKQILSILSKFAFSLIALVIAIVRIYLGYVPSSRIIKYDNITATDKPINFWFTIAGLFLISFGLFIWGVISAIKYRKSVEK